MIPSKDITKDLLLSETLSKNKDAVLPFLESQLTLYQELLIKAPHKDLSNSIKKIIKSIQLIKANVDPKSALDYFFLA